MSGLVLHKDIELNVEAARDYLAKSVDMIGVKEVRDKAETIKRYLRTRGASLECQNDAAEIALRAARRLGELTRELPKASGSRGEGRPSLGGRKAGPPKSLSAPTLADQGIDKRDASKWQAIASIPSKQFESHLTEVKEKAERITTNGAVALARLEKKTTLAATLSKKPLPAAEGQFNVIVIDPPWRYEKRAEDVTHRGRNPYPDMDLASIKALPVADRAEDDCVLWLWTTNGFMREAFECLDAWGFTQKTILTWAKDRMGTGDWLRGKTEHCLLAVRGRPVVTLTNQTTLLAAPLREHSRKPDEFFALVEALCPGTKLEMFAREKRSGWQAWGAETGAFEKSA